MKPRDYPLEIQLLYFLADNQIGCVWKPSEDLEYKDCQLITLKDWPRLVRHLKAEGLVISERETTRKDTSFCNQKTVTFYRATPKGHQLLKSLGIKAGFSNG